MSLRMRWRLPKAAAIVHSSQEFLPLARTFADQYVKLVLSRTDAKAGTVSIPNRQGGDVVADIGSADGSVLLKRWGPAAAQRLPQVRRG